MTTLWTHESAADATGGIATGQWEATRVEIDSRKVQKGDLFVAIRGEQFDGHDFVKAALDKGAVAAIVSQPPAGVDADALLIVPDTLGALEDLGREARVRTAARVVGVTGSVGKTSTKEMLKLVLAAHGRTYATVGNYNNHIGTPLNLANLPPDAQFAVFEMGMNHAGEIAHLTRMVRPHIAAITTVEAVHIEFFDSVEGIADAKAEIFDTLGATELGILNRDNPHYAQSQRRAAEYGVSRIATFGEHEKADCRLVSFAPTAHGAEVVANIYGERVHYTMEAVGRHWALTTLMCFAVCHALGLPVARTVQALTQFGELAGRGQLVTPALQGGTATLIDDSYYASPPAMRAALAKTQEVWQAQGGKGRKIAVLGNMLELSKDAPAMHTALAPDLITTQFDCVFTAGELMRQVHDALPASVRAGHTTEAMQLLPMLITALKAGDVVLVKGSHGSHMYKLAEALVQAHSTVKDTKHAV